jgi:hypothetical protein
MRNPSHIQSCQRHCNDAQWKQVRTVHSNGQRNTLKMCGSCAFPEERFNTEASAATYGETESAFATDSWLHRREIEHALKV